MERDINAYYYQKDALGTITAITDSAGITVQKYEYDSFGSVTFTQDANFIQPYTFTGREYDPETGLYHYRARAYNAKTGTFLQEDPIGFEGGINLYSYVGNDPINWIDPEGLKGGRARPGRRPNNKGTKDFLDKASELPGFNLGDPDCVYRAVKKCVKYVCGSDPNCPGPWIVNDVTKSCWCAEEKVVLECR